MLQYQFCYPLHEILRYLAHLNHEFNRLSVALKDGWSFRWRFGSMLGGAAYGVRLLFSMDEKLISGNGVRCASLSCSLLIWCMSYGISCGNKLCSSLGC